MHMFSLADISPGDQVTLEHDDGSKLVREVKNLPINGANVTVEIFPGQSPSLSYVLTLGWRITAVVKPVPELPTEPGYYADRDGDPWQLKPEDDNFEPRWYNGSGFQGADAAAIYAPFTRLAPVPETAKKVIDRVAESFPGMAPATIIKLADLAAEFGVTDA